MDVRSGPGDSPAALTDSLVQVSFTVIALLSQKAAEHDLSLTQLRVLAILRDREPKMAELAAHLGLDRSSVSGLIDRAVRRGLVRRDSGHEDGRVVRVALTAAGHELAGLVSREISDQIALLAAGLAPADQDGLAALLTRVLETSGRAWAAS
jgi:DNA-binding MarR family transcriptional regulator